MEVIIIMGTGTVLKNILASRNISIKDLSEKTGISVNTLYSITARDSKNIRSDTLQKISEALKLNGREILDLTNPGYLEEIQDMVHENNEREQLLMQRQISEIVSYFEQLNINGRIEAVNRIEELTLIEKYKRGNL
jgi:DNA-binding Xre family transcriptional regulator